MVIGSGYGLSPVRLQAITWTDETLANIYIIFHLKNAFDSAEQYSMYIPGTLTYVRQGTRFDIL